MTTFKKWMLMVSIFLFPLMVQASDGEGEHGGIPMAFIKLQVINFVVFAAVIVFLSKSKIAPVFKQVREDFLAKSQEAKTKLEESKKEKEDLQDKILSLEKNYDKELTKAEEQAKSKYKHDLITVKENVTHMGKDLDVHIASLKRARVAELRELMMEKSVGELKSELDGEVEEKILLQIQDTFVNSVEARI